MEKLKITCNKLYMTIKITKVSNMYLEPNKISMMKFFCENITRFLQKSSIIDTGLVSKYSSEYNKKSEKLSFLPSLL